MVFLPWIWLYFYCYIAVACLVLMNLVTAIIVENAMSKAANDHELATRDKHDRRRREIMEFVGLFADMDLDQSGTLTLDEFQASFEDQAIKRHWMMLDFNGDDCK